MQRRNNTVVPLGMLRRFLGASVFSIVVTSFFFVHVHVSPSPSDHKFNDKILSVCLFSLSFLCFTLFFRRTKIKSLFF